MKKAAIGLALAAMPEDVVDEVLGLVRAYRDPETPFPEDMIKQAVDSPARARARIQQWAFDYNAVHGSGAAQSFLNDALATAGSSETVATIDAQILALENQAATIVDNVNNNVWTWDQVAEAIESQFSTDTGIVFSYRELPIPPGYVTVWGEPY